MTTSTPLRAAVIGAGHMGKHHARIYSEFPETRLAAVVDLDRSRAESLTGKHGGDACANLEEVIGRIDLATVAVPTVHHAAVAKPLIEAGIPILIEKPLAQDSETARQILEWADKHGTIVQVGHSERFNPVVRAMQRMEVKPRFIETHRISPFAFRSADIGVVFDMMIHDIDIILHLVKDRDWRVHAVGVNVLGPYEDIANARIAFANGSVVNMTASRLATKTERKIRVFSPDAYLSLDYHRKSGIAIKKDANLDLIGMLKDKNLDDLSQWQGLDFTGMVKIEPLIVDDVEPLRAEIEAFTQAVRTKTASPIPPQDGLAAVQLAEDIVSALKSNAWNL